MFLSFLILSQVVVVVGSLKRVGRGKSVKLSGGQDCVGRGVVGCVDTDGIVVLTTVGCSLLDGGADGLSPQLLLQETGQKLRTVSDVSQ